MPVPLKTIEFDSLSSVDSATAADETTYDEESARLGTITHNIIEKYWNNFSSHQEEILDKVQLFDGVQREQVKASLDNFYKSDIYRLLQGGVEHRFKLEFNRGDKHGFIDFVYFNESRDGWVIVDFKTGQKSREKELNYQSQLDFYEGVVYTLGYRVVDTMLLWI